MAWYGRMKNGKTEEEGSEMEKVKRRKWRDEGGSGEKNR